MKCPKCQYIGFDGHTRCRHCGYDLSLAATAEEVTPAGTDMPFDAAPDVPDAIYRPEPSARAQARAAIQKRAASRTPQPESFDLPLFATPGVDDRPALPASRPPLVGAPRRRSAARPGRRPPPSLRRRASRSPAASETIDPAAGSGTSTADAMRIPTPASRRGSSSTPCRWRRSPIPIRILICR